MLEKILPAASSMHYPYCIMSARAALPEDCGEFRDMNKVILTSLTHAISYVKLCKGDEKEQAKVFHFYIKQCKYICDWDGVDDSAPYIVGPYLLQCNKTILYKLARSKQIEDRRIAIISTWWFIRHNEFADTLKIAIILLQDQEDLIHKGEQAGCYVK